MATIEKGMSKFTFKSGHSKITFTATSVIGGYEVTWPGCSQPSFYEIADVKSKIEKYHWVVEENLSAPEPKTLPITLERIKQFCDDYPRHIISYSEGQYTVDTRLSYYVARTDDGLVDLLDTLINLKKYAN